MSKNSVKDGPDGCVLVDISTEKFTNKHMMADKTEWARIDRMVPGKVFAQNPNSKGRFYAQAVVVIGNRAKNVMIHRLVMPGEARVGFKNGNSLDCRKSNLASLPYGRKLRGTLASPVVRPGRKSQGNEVEEKDGVVRVNVSTASFRNAIMLIDSPDWERVRPLVGRLHAHDTNATGLAFARGKHKGLRKTVMVHRLLMPETDKVQFLNGNTLDCRRANLAPMGSSAAKKAKRPSLMALERSMANALESPALPVTRHYGRKPKPQPEGVQLDAEFWKNMEYLITTAPPQQVMAFGKFCQARAEAGQKKAAVLYEGLNGLMQRVQS